MIEKNLILFREEDRSGVKMFVDIRVMSTEGRESIDKVYTMGLSLLYFGPR